MQQDSRIMYFLKSAWPTVNRILTSVFYFLLTLIRGMVSRAIEQIRNF